MLALRFLPYVLRSILRNPGRTSLTVGIVAVGTFVLAYFGAYGDSWDRVLAASGSDVVLVTGRKNVR